MNKLIKLHLSVLILVIPAFAQAQTAPDMELAAKYGCTACHQVENKIIGPSYSEVYEKYKDDENAQATLEAKVRDGGAGVWGEIPMIPHPDIPEADLQTLVKGILGKA